MMRRLRNTGPRKSLHGAEKYGEVVSSGKISSHRRNTQDESTNRRAQVALEGDALRAQNSCRSWARRRRLYRASVCDDHAGHDRRVGDCRDHPRAGKRHTIRDTWSWACPQARVPGRGGIVHRPAIRSRDEKTDRVVAWRRLPSRTAAFPRATGSGRQIRGNSRAAVFDGGLQGGDEVGFLRVAHHKSPTEQTRNHGRRLAERGFWLRAGRENGDEDWSGSPAWVSISTSLPPLKDPTSSHASPRFPLC